MRRRNEATERVRSSCSPVALATVRRPRSFCGPVRVGRGGSTTFVGMPGRRMMRLASSSSAGVAARAVAGAAVGVAVASGRRAAGAAVADGRRRRAADFEAALGFLLGAALGFGVVGAARVFLALALLSGQALFALAAFALFARLGIDHGQAAFLFLALTGAGEGASTRLLLFLGQGAQHDTASATARRGTLWLGTYALRMRGARLHGRRRGRGRCRSRLAWRMRLTRA